MPVKKDKDGRRSVEAKIEVPGSPEEVWQAIATSEGLSSWFVPSKIEEREGGTAVYSFGLGMDSTAKITEWNPPKSFSAETEEGPGRVSTEWIVESRKGGTCVVRVVHRWFVDTDDWDDQFEGHAYGWATSFFHVLRLYLSHFPGQRCSAFQLSAVSDRSSLESWHTIKDALNVDRGTIRFGSKSATPELSGIVERQEITDPELLRVRASSPLVVAALEGMEGEDPELFLRLDRPAAGLSHVMVVPMEDQTLVSLRFHFYGADSAEVAAAAEREWSEWLAEQFSQEASQ